MNRHTVHELCRHMRAELPAGAPVSLRITQPAKRSQVAAHAWWDESKQRYFIQIDPCHSTERALGLLVHEYAHVLSWGLDHDSDQHGEMFIEARRVCFDAYKHWRQGQKEE